VKICSPISSPEYWFYLVFFDMPENKKANKINDLLAFGDF